MDIIIILIAIVTAIYLIFKLFVVKEEDNYIPTYTSISQNNTTTLKRYNDLLPKILEMVQKNGSIIVDPYIDSQWEKNKIGYYLNSIDFIKEYNSDDKYIVDVIFFDKEKRIGDVEKISIKLNSSPNPQKIDTDNIVYKSPQIKDYRIQGAQYRGLTDDDLGKFFGYVKTEPENPYDCFAIAVYNENGKHLGYVPRGCEQLFNTLQQLYGGKQQAWGFMQKQIDDEMDRVFLYGEVFIPIKCSKAKLEKALSEFKATKPRKIVKYK